MLKNATRRISAFFIAFIAGVFILPSTSLAAESPNMSLDLNKVPLTAVTLEKAVIAGLSVNKNSCSSNLKDTPQTVYQCLNTVQMISTYKNAIEDDLIGLPKTGETPKEDVAKVISTPKPQPTVIATPTSSPLSTPVPTATPQPAPANKSFTPPAGSLSADTYFNMINNHRATKGLPAFEKHPQLCEVAASRGPELNNEIFGNSYIHAGFRKLNLPYWATENMIGYPTEEIGFSWWMSSSVHRQAIESPDYKYACGTCVGKACAMLFTSFSPKQT